MVKILIIDEYPASVDSLIGPLIRAPLQVYLAENRPRALQLITEVQPEIVLLDTTRTASCTDEFYLQITSVARIQNTSIVLMTDSAHRDDQEYLAYDHIEKPIHVPTALARIRPYIALHELNGELQARDSLLQKERELRLQLERDNHDLLEAAQGQEQPDAALSDSLLPAEGVGQVGDLQHRLSQREFQVLHFLLEGHTSVDIGRLLDVSDATVRTYRSRIMQKLDVPNFVALVKMSILNGITRIS